MSAAITRRTALSGAVASVAMVGAAAAAAMPSMTHTAASAAFRAALDTSDAARRRFNNLPEHLEATDEALHAREIDLMIAASCRADAATPTTWQEYTRLIEHMTDDGHSAIGNDNAERLLAHARRLAHQGG